MNKGSRRCLLRTKCCLLVIVLCIAILSALPGTASANSAEPPSLVILVNNPPDDLAIVMVSNDNKPEASVRRVAWEGYYVFYSRDMQADGKYRFKVATKGESFECTIDTPLQHYNNVFTLDLAQEKLTPGKYPFRQAILVSIRLLLTLIIEGVVFWLFGFRQRRSWLVFLAINLVTQGALNLWLNNGGSLLPSYLLIALIIGEFFVFVAELIAFPYFIKEHKKSRILIYVIAANLLSLIAGGYIISVLPV
ncbi:hypothetical protein Desor_2171 [Desulfosporosinus orientis DSM 765]|uniref:Uncharacterized protein n=1 Tax=Desulfosporosinus orientis (strain ATCC 19365 / DSM 765 / NCIMB 8382 / VKM B-1628 / Singapore I) TaxID=768706 RepID=G7W8R5_DESOD|nr:hypothetical protein [Desulfosporosinus orientis]AET67775.1 hypothetical protein Desor_2171 [Desulfosporosinus orientis DSM 765]